MKTLITLITVIASLSTLAQRGHSQEFKLSMKGKSFQDQSTIYLKKQLKKKHPHLNLEKWDLKRVVLFAKSKKGQAKAHLKIGRFDSRKEFIDGNHHDFRDRGNYHKVSFEAPRQDKGNWQLHLKGNVKVKEVVVFAKKDKRQPHTPQVTKTCSYVLETVWGKDIKKFSASASGKKGSGVQASACKKAKKKCISFKGELPLTTCQKL